MKYDRMSKMQLETLATEAGLEIIGSGRNGSILKSDLIAALEVPRVEEIAEEPVRLRYQMDKGYEVLEAFGGHPVGEIVVNLPRWLGQEQLEKGALRETDVHCSNPNAVTTTRFK